MTSPGINTEARDAMAAIDLAHVIRTHIKTFMSRQQASDVLLSLGTPDGNTVVPVDTQYLIAHLGEDGASEWIRIANQHRDELIAIATIALDQDD